MTKPKNDQGEAQAKTRQTTPKATPLFREEAIRHRTRALFGDVVLAAPISTWIITLLLLCILIGVICFGIFTNIQVNGQSIPLWRWILRGSA